MGGVRAAAETRSASANRHGEDEFKHGEADGRGVDEASTAKNEVSERALAGVTSGVTGMVSLVVLHCAGGVLESLKSGVCARGCCSRRNLPARCRGHSCASCSRGSCSKDEGAGERASCCASAPRSCSAVRKLPAAPARGARVGKALGAAPTAEPAPELECATLLANSPSACRMAETPEIKSLLIQISQSPAAAVQRS